MGHLWREKIAPALWLAGLVLVLGWALGGSIAHAEPASSSAGGESVA